MTELVVTSLAVPTSVRVAAGWDRTAPTWSFINQLRGTDLSLDSASANLAAVIRTEAGVSVPDAHLGAGIQTTAADRVTVLTSDPGDMRRFAGSTSAAIVLI